MERHFKWKSLCFRFALQPGSKQQNDFRFFFLSSSCCSCNAAILCRTIEGGCRYWQFFLRADGISQDEVESGKELCRWILEALDWDKNHLVHISAWSELCISLAKASLCMTSGLPIEKFADMGILQVAPMHAMGDVDIVGLHGTSLMDLKSGELKGLHSFIKKHKLLEHYPWLQSVQDDIQLLHLDLTGSWDADLMT